MPRDTRKIIKRLTARLFTYPVEDYLASGEFFNFCRDHDAGDAWKEYLELSQDTPDLYGRAVIKNAFGLFLHHIFHRRPDEFLKAVTHCLSWISGKIPDRLPVDELKNDMMDLGYSDRDLETEFLSFTGT
jgi:hypothetical protein